MESRKMQCDRIILSTAMLLLAVLCDKNPSQPGMIPVSLKITVPSSVICSGGTFQFRSMAVYTDETSRDVTDETLWSVIPGHAGSMKNGGLFIASIDSVGEEIIQSQSWFLQEGRRNLRPSLNSPVHIRIIHPGETT